MPKPTLIDGWMGAGPRRWLKRRAKKALRIIEVGVWKGRSTAILARYSKGRVWAVDHWQGVPHDPAQHDQWYAEADATGDAIYAEFRRNLRGYIKAGRVVPVRAASVDAAAQLLRAHGPVYDLIFIDADHSYEGCRADILAYRPLVKPGGILSGHDYDLPGVKQAVDELIPKPVLGPASLWSVKL